MYHSPREDEFFKSLAGRSIEELLETEADDQSFTDEEVERLAKILRKAIDRVIKRYSDDQTKH